MSDPTQPNEPVPPADPTEQMPTASASPPPQQRTATTTTTTPPGPPPSPGGVSGGVVATIAIGVAAIALLLGFLVWGQDDDSDVATDDATSAPEDVAPEDSAPEDTAPEDTGEVDDLQSEVDDLQSQLDDVTGERDDLQSQLDDIAEGMVELDDLEGMSIDDVRDLASDNGWELVEQEPDSAADDAETDTVLSQSPGSGTTMIEGSLLLVEVIPG